MGRVWRERRAEGEDRVHSGQVFTQHLLGQSSLRQSSPVLCDRNLEFPGFRWEWGGGVRLSTNAAQMKLYQVPQPPPAASYPPSSFARIVARCSPQAPSGTAFQGPAGQSQERGRRRGRVCSHRDGLPALLEVGCLLLLLDVLGRRQEVVQQHRHAHLSRPSGRRTE